MQGARLGNYSLLRKLGEGGMGEVWLAEHRRIGKRAAVKLLQPQLSADAAVVERFFNEARAAAVIEHPAIVEIFDCDVHEGRAYIVMEFLQGESLRALLARVGTLADDPGAISALGQQAGSALGAAHAKGIVHRDLKPDNLFMLNRPSGAFPFQVKVLDFGIAKLLAQAGSKSRTSSGMILGTPLYMSPEQCRGAGHIDARADIYSLGCILFELAAGRPPFVREGSGELIAAHLVESPPSLRDLVPTVDDELDALVSEMLAKSPDDRPPTMDEVVSRLQAVSTATVKLRVLAPPPEAEVPVVPSPAPVSAPADWSLPAVVSPTPAPASPPVAFPAHTPSGTAVMQAVRDTGPRGNDAPGDSGARAGGTRIMSVSERDTGPTTLGGLARTREPEASPAARKPAPVLLVAGGVIALLAVALVWALLRPASPREATLVPVRPVAPAPAPAAALPPPVAPPRPEPAPPAPAPVPVAAPVAPAPEPAVTPAPAEKPRHSRHREKKHFKGFDQL